MLSNAIFCSQPYLILCLSAVINVYCSRMLCAAVAVCHFYIYMQQLNFQHKRKYLCKPQTPLITYCSKFVSQAENKVSNLLIPYCKWPSCVDIKIYYRNFSCAINWTIKNVLWKLENNLIYVIVMLCKLGQVVSVDCQPRCWRIEFQLCQID